MCDISKEKINLIKYTTAKKVVSGLIILRNGEIRTFTIQIVW